MKHKQSYPYPILSDGNDVEGVFNPTFSYTLRPQLIETEFTFDLKNQTLENLVKEKKAKFVIEMECNTTFFRETFTSFDSKGSINIEANRLRDKVDVGFYLCAETKIKDYRPAGLHRDYGTASFPIEPGDILADGGRCSFIADKKFDPLNAPTSSFIKMGDPLKKPGSMIIDYDGDILQIRLPQEEYEKYQDTKNQAVHPVVSMLVLPALAEALRVMNEEEKRADYEEKKWYIRLKAICREQRIRDDDPLDAAQKILGYPLLRGFNQLFSITDK